MQDFFIPAYALEAPAAPILSIESLVVPQELAQPATKTPSSKAFRIAKLFALVGVIILLISWGPSVFLRLTGEANHYKVNAQSLPIISSSYQPSFDKTLGMGNSIKIASIKVDGPIHESQIENFEDALKKGIWRTTDFGTPYQRELPTILAAHRFGYLEWSNVFRRENSFFNLPNLAIGDTVEIIWNQRKYTYAVYGEGKGLEITDYTADLILYTCEDLSSDVKVFKYARLLEI